MLKLREMLQRTDDPEFVCLQGLMTFMLQRVLHEEMRRERRNLPLFGTISLDGPWESQPHACWVMLTHAAQGSASSFCFQKNKKLYTN